MPRRYVTPEELRRGGRLVLGEDAHRYLCRVLRLEVGSRVDLFDGEGNEASAAVALVGSRTVDLEILGPVHRAGERLPGSAPAITLVVALLKGEKMDLVVQKATELGASAIWPVLTARAVPRVVAAREAGRRSRWQRIAREAARQCGRNDIPDIEPLRELPEALEQAASARGVHLLFYERADERASLPDVLTRNGDEVRAPDGGIFLLVGPEGGFADEEVAAAREAGFVACGLGPRMLRAETAAIAALAIAGFALGDLR